MVAYNQMHLQICCSFTTFNGIINEHLKAFSMISATSIMRRRGALPPTFIHFFSLLGFTLAGIIILVLFETPFVPVPPPYVRSKTYITSDCEDGRRLGNLMFNYASMVGIGERYNMTIVMQPHFRLFKIFELSAVISEDITNTLGSHRVYEEFGRRACAYDMGVEKLSAVNTRLQGYFQSYRYFNHSAGTVRKEFKFKRLITSAAADFLLRSKQQQKQQGVVTVGIHVRRGDYLQPYYSNYGYRTADMKYFNKAIEYFSSKYHAVLFVVCSDDIEWSRQNIVGDNIVYSDSASDIIDLAILSQCDHSIMSTGSFGWWGSWLANGTTIYYDGWPRPVSVLEYMVTKTDFFPPYWIPMQ